MKVHRAAVYAPVNQDHLPLDVWSHMRIDVIGRHFDVSDAIKVYAESKANKLTKYFSGLQQITVTISKIGSHHTNEYDVELVLDVEKHDDFVSHAKHADTYAAIDLVVEKGERQLRDFKEKLQKG